MNKRTPDRARKRGVGKSPAVVLINPKYPRNVGAVVRAASCFGIRQIWFTGTRVPTVGDKGYRLPREERMKGYMEVELYNNEYPIDAFNGVIPIAVEVNDNSENLVDFIHPENAVYVFGPEDGSIPQSYRCLCHRFLYIPTYHCLNLAMAVNVILYDRMAKSDLMDRPSDKRFIGDS